MSADELTADERHRLEDAYLATYDKLWRSLLAFTHNPDVASDACAEAFAQAAGRGAAIRDVEAWVWRSAFRIARGLLAMRQPAVHDRDELAAIAPETALDLLDALRQLSDQQRQCVVLHYYAGYPPREIAGLVGSTPNSVRVQLHTARKRLRQLLEDQND